MPGPSEANSEPSGTYVESSGSPAAISIPSRGSRSRRCHGACDSLCILNFCSHLIREDGDVLFSKGSVCSPRPAL